MAYWACRPCTAYSQGITKRVRELDNKVTDLQDSVSEIKDDLTSVKGSITKVEERVKKAEEQSTRVAEDNTKVIFEEMRDRESRRLNVVLHGVPEHPDQAAPGREKQKWDREQCNKISQVLCLNLSDNDIKFVRRVGAKEEGPRPLVAGFYTEMERSLLLRHAKKLEGTEFDSVKVAPDLTKRQRKEERDLWGELETRNNNRTEEQQQKNLAWLVVGARGEKRLVLQPSRAGPQRLQVRGRGRPYTRPAHLNRMGETQQTLQTESNIREPGRLTRGSDRALTRALSQPTTMEETEEISPGTGTEGEAAEMVAEVTVIAGTKRKAGTAMEGQPPDKEKR